MVTADIFTSEIPLLTVTVRLLAAALCGALIGWDRERKGRPAGLRTHVMVALGSAGFTLVAISFLESLSDDRAFMATDALRVVSGIIGGIGFLGAGAIIQSRGNVRGLTTAAGIWTVAACGVALGLGYALIAVLLVTFSMITIVGGRMIEQKLFGKVDQG